MIRIDAIERGRPRGPQMDGKADSSIANPP